MIHMETSNPSPPYSTLYSLYTFTPFTTPGTAETFADKPGPQVGQLL